MSPSLPAPPSPVCVIHGMHICAKEQEMYACMMDMVHIDLVIMHSYYYIIHPKCVISPFLRPCGTANATIPSLPPIPSLTHVHIRSSPFHPQSEKYSDNLFSLIPAPCIYFHPLSIPLLDVSLLAPSHAQFPIFNHLYPSPSIPSIPIPPPITNSK